MSRLNDGLISGRICGCHAQTHEPTHGRRAGEGRRRACRLLHAAGVQKAGVRGVLRLRGVARGGAASAAHWVTAGSTRLRRAAEQAAAAQGQRYLGASHTPTPEVFRCAPPRAARGRGGHAAQACLQHTATNSQGLTGGALDFVPTEEPSRS